jgi:hypothetical protein
MQSIVEHQEIPKEEAAGTPVGEPRKRRRVQNLAAERCQKRKERTRGNHGSKRLAAACRKVSRRPKVTWRKRNLFRNVQTQRKCGPRKEFAVARKNVPRRAKVVWRKRNMARKKCTRACGTRNPERMGVREETLEGPRIQQWLKEPRC